MFRFEQSLRPASWPNPSVGAAAVSSPKLRDGQQLGDRARVAACYRRCGSRRALARGATTIESKVASSRNDGDAMLEQRRSCLFGGNCPGKNTPFPPHSSLFLMVWRFCGGTDACVARGAPGFARVLGCPRRPNTLAVASGRGVCITAEGNWAVTGQPFPHTHPHELLPGWEGREAYRLSCGIGHFPHCPAKTTPLQNTTKR